MHLSSLAAAASSLSLLSRQSNTTAPIPTTLTVNLTTTYQTIDGFGFSEAFQRAHNIISGLDDRKRAEVIDLFFNTTSGAGFSIVRNGIGSSPNSSLDWMNTFVPVGPARPDDKPTIVWDGKDSGQLWVSQQAVGHPSTYSGYREKDWYAK